jgi:hypothetical protein
MDFSVLFSSFFFEQEVLPPEYNEGEEMARRLTASKTAIEPVIIQFFRCMVMVLSLDVVKKQNVTDYL